MIKKKRYFFKNGIELNPENVELMKRIENGEEIINDLNDLVRLINQVGYNEKINSD